MDVQSHRLRGHMVQRRTEKEIATEAVAQFYFFNQKMKELNIEKFIDLLSLQGISVHILTNAEWRKKHTFLKKGESIPGQKRIVLPKQVLDNAKKGDREAIRTFFHELAHVVLRHEPIYLQADSDYKITVLDDAEEQADLFAKIMFMLYGIEEEPKQMQFNF